MNYITYDRKVKASTKKLNDVLQEDVFGDRFEVRLLEKASEDGITYYQYEMIDHEQPERNRVIRGWLTYWDICSSNKLYIEMNDFIVHSDFWSRYRQETR